MTAARRSLIGDLDDAVRNGSKSDRVETLRRITNLFMASSERLTDEQIDIFDDVISHLMRRVENRNLAELSQRLAPVVNAPNNVVQTLARNDEIAIAGPVLTFSARLTSCDLIEIAKSKPQGHLQAIACRTDIGPNVTDVLLDRGNNEVRQNLVGNLSARFSEEGMCLLIGYAEGDGKLPAGLARRPDLPLHLLRSLLEHASDDMRREIAATAPPAQRTEIVNLLESMGCELPDDDADSSSAKAEVAVMFQDGELDEIALLQFARKQQFSHLTAALAVLCGMEVEDMKRVCGTLKVEDMLMPCRAAGVSWNAFRAIVASTPAGAALGEARLSELKKDYARLATSTAQRVLHLRSRQLSALE
ncbi:DUF2336 domain-containing protein [Pseudorhodoplanes sp.]|uniref:DUF2336 domain-containing protein n=1 Tax=Pseudorhodoplanes sp. TaxID=1934341 RepID=UPI003919C4B3